MSNPRSKKRQRQEPPPSTRECKKCYATWTPRECTVPFCHSERLVGFDEDCGYDAGTCRRHTETERVCGVCVRPLRLNLDAPECVHEYAWFVGSGGVLCKDCKQYVHKDCARPDDDNDWVNYYCRLCESIVDGRAVSVPVSILKRGLAAAGLSEDQRLSLDAAICAHMGVAWARVSRT